MTEIPCLRCRTELSEGTAHISRFKDFDHHYKCLVAWVGDDQERCLEALKRYVLHHGSYESRMYRYGRLITPLLNLTPEKMENLLGRLDDLQESQCEFYINAGGVSALIDEGLTNVESFLTNHGNLIDPDEYYELTNRGHLLPPSLVCAYSDAITEMMTGGQKLSQKQTLFYLNVLHAHHRAIEDRRKRHWSTVFTAILLGKVISSYLKKKYAPGSQEMQIAQTRFETGDYQV